MRASSDLTGRKFTRLTVLGMKGRNKHNQILWECKCDCGNTVVSLSCDLRNNCTKSCGCLRRERGYTLAKNYLTKHGERNTRLYGIWSAMKNRCYNTKLKCYKYYGGKGIRVCDEWLNDFSAFCNWAMKNGYQENLTIDRIDGNLNYQPSNCRWVTRREQMNNRSTTMFLTYANKTKPLTEWAQIYDIKPITLRNRIYRGWSVEKALTTPIKKKRNS